MSERKVSKPRVVRMWAVWHDDSGLPFIVERRRDEALRRAWLTGSGVVRVEVREVKKKRRSKKQ